MLSMRSHHKTVPLWLLYLLLGSCVVSALAVLILATRHDTTLLGDPYYEDQILAPQRALVPWIMTCATLLLGLIAGVLGRLKK